MKNHCVRLILSCLLLWCSCSKKVQHKFDAFDTSQTIELNAYSNNVVGWVVNINGNIDGHLCVYVKHISGAIQDSIPISSGKVNIERRGDWFAPKLLLEIKPLTKTSGELTIESTLSAF